MGTDQPLPPGRCIGASAVPVFTPEATAPANLVIPASETGPPTVVTGTTLASNNGVFNHAYAMLTLEKSDLTINYYQINSSAATPGHPRPWHLLPIAIRQPRPPLRKPLLEKNVLAKTMTVVGTERNS
jgi:hypothetical protein